MYIKLRTGTLIIRAGQTQKSVHAANPREVHLLAASAFDYIKLNLQQLVMRARFEKIPGFDVISPLLRAVSRVLFLCARCIYLSAGVHVQIKMHIGVHSLLTARPVAFMFVCLICQRVMYFVMRISHFEQSVSPPGVKLWSVKAMR